MKHKYRLPLRLVVYLLLLTMLATGVSLSRYKTTVAGSATVSVARPVVEYVAGSWTGDPLSFEPGETLVYTFSVRNYDTSGRTEVTMGYTVTVNLTDPASAAFPFTWALTVDDNGDGSYDAYSGGNQLFGFAQDQQHTYRLTFSWDAADSAAVYMNLTQKLKVIVSAYQVN